MTLGTFISMPDDIAVVAAEEGERRLARKLVPIRRTLLQAVALGDEIAQRMLKLENQTNDDSSVERVAPL